MGGSDDQMTDANNDLEKLEEKYLGPSYNYSKFIKTPSGLGMSAEGKMEVLADDIGGLMAYVGLLVDGRSNASTTRRPLGNKFFLPTSLKCNDTVTGEEATRSIYINNVPDGQIPFISNAMGGTGFSQFRGLVPGLMSNMAQIHPMGILSAFTAGDAPDCQSITMETIDASNVSGTGVAYVTHADIKMMNPEWFPSRTRPTLIMEYSNKSKADGAKKSENFTTLRDTMPMNDMMSINDTKPNYSQMPADVFIKLYYSALGLIGIYLLLKIFLKKKVK
jgi:hypothetical protein